MQSPSPSILTLAAAESIALAQSPDVAEAEAELRSAWAACVAAYSPFLPSISTSASWYRFDRQVISFRNDEMYFSKDRYSLGLSGSFPLFSGGRDLIFLLQARMAHQRARLAYDDAVARVRAEVVAAYLDLVRCVMELSVAKQALERALDEQRIVQQKLSLGSASEVDASKMRVQVAQKRLSKLQAENAVERAREALCVLLAFPLDTSFEVDTTLPPPQDVPPIDSFLSRLGSNRSIAQAKLELSSAKLERLSAWLSYLPRLSLSASWSWSGGETPPDLKTLADEASFSYGITLSWTLFAGTERVGGIEGANAALDLARTSAYKAEVSAQQAAREAYRSMVEALEAYRLSVAQVDDALLTLRTTRERYELGSATLLELLDAELALEQAQLQRITALTNFHAQKAKLLWLVGER